MTALVDAPAAPYVPVRNLMLHVTSSCNLRCSYCFVQKAPKTMSVETARRAVDFVFQRAVTGAEPEVGITFFGGEPFLELDVLGEVVRHARLPRPNIRKRVRFAATTNGTVASSRVEHLVRDADMSLLVSLDGGHEAASFRPFTSGRSSHAMVVRNLPRLVEWSRDVMVRATFHPGSLDLLGNVRQLFELGAPQVALCPALEGDWRAAEADLQRAYEALGAWYLDEARAGRIPGLAVSNTLLKQMHRGRTSGERPLKPCGVGSSMLGVDPDGNVMPCHRFLHRRDDWLGTVRQPSPTSDRKRYTTLRSSDMMGCEGCDAREMCGGGCRAVALNAGLGLHDPHPNHCHTMRIHAAVLRSVYDTLMAEANPGFLKMLRTADKQSPVGELALR